jgi:GntR family transcriptional repressor for pyruvate dehydrogenase complex
MPFREIRDIKKKSAYVAEQIIEAIRNGEFAVGDKLPAERELAELMRISRNSVREALSALQIAGIVESRAGEGTYVAEQAVVRASQQEILTLVDEGVDLLEIWKAREEIETAITGLAVSRANQEDIEQIREVLEEMREAARSNDTEKYLQANVDYHLCIARAAHNLPLQRALDSLLRITRQISHILGDVERGYVSEHLERSFVIHEHIFCLIEGRDEGGVDKAIRDHFKELVNYLRGEFV